LADQKRKKVINANHGKSAVENKNGGLLDSKVSRRKAVGTGAVVGAAVAGLAIGVAGGYFAGSSSSSGSTATVTSTSTEMTGGTGTSTVTNTVTNTITSTATGTGGNNPLVGNVVVQTLAGGGDEWAGWVAKNYNAEHPGANVTTSPIPQCNMNAYSITAVQSGPPPDVVYNSTLPAFNAQIVTPGYALQLDQYVTEYDWANETLGTFSAYGYVNNHWYWFTEGSIYYGNIYYNEDMFTKMNLAPPTDQASLAAAATALTAAGIYPVAHGYQTQPEWFMNTFSDWLMNHVSIADYTAFSTNYGSGLYSSSFASRNLTFESPKVMDIWNYLQVVGSKYLAPGSVTMSDGTASGLFAAGKTGMYWIGSWGAGVLESIVNKAFTYGIEPISLVTPGFANTASTPPNPLYIVGFPLPYFVLHNTKNPALVADYLNAMLAPGAQIANFAGVPTASGSMSPCTGGDFPIIPLGASIATDPYLQRSLALNASLTGVPSLAAAVDTALHNPIETAIGAVLSGNQTPAQAAASVEQLAIQLNSTGPTTATSSSSS
jgi:ABC-type glycerol-3-phosphate transport system substrate-binding protein